MRLMQRDSAGNFNLTKELYDGEIPPYAILSHTWHPDGEEEVSFDDVTNGRGKDKRGYEKLEFCARQSGLDGLHYFWVDTCCINRASSSELSESIISMFRWYANAEKCYVYLIDVPRIGSDDLEDDLRRSRWFTRGWTLQELLAPAELEFFGAHETSLGTRSSRAALISAITRIPLEALQARPLSEFSYLTRLMWQEGRSTKKVEDLVYSLSGLLETPIAILYGEGSRSAWRRLIMELKWSREVEPQTLLEEATRKGNQWAIQIILESGVAVKSSLNQMRSASIVAAAKHGHRKPCGPAGRPTDSSTSGRICKRWRPRSRTISTR